MFAEGKEQKPCVGSTQAMLVRSVSVSFYSDDGFQPMQKELYNNNDDGFQPMQKELYNNNDKKTE